MKILHFIALIMLPISIANSGYTMDVDSDDDISNENQITADNNNIITQMENLNIDSESDSENKDTKKQIQELKEIERRYIKRIKEKLQREGHTDETVEVIKFINKTYKNERVKRLIMLDSWSTAARLQISNYFNQHGYYYLYSHLRQIQDIFNIRQQIKQLSNNK